MKTGMILGMRNDTSVLKARAKSYQIFFEDLIGSPFPEAA
jgi:hypothetical protein